MRTGMFALAAGLACLPLLPQLPPTWLLLALLPLALMLLPWRSYPLALLLFGFVWACFSAQAALDGQGRQEVDALLAFVESSGCQFIRNGSEHSPVDARKHLQKKLDYLDDKGLVDSPEDFIARAATESSMSEEPYQVNCQGRLQRSADWLNGELSRLRQAR